MKNTEFKIAGAVVPGAGAFEIFAWQELQKYKDEIKGKSRLGIQAYAEALLIIPKIICKFLIFLKIFYILVKKLIAFVTNTILILSINNF